METFFLLAQVMGVAFAVLLLVAIIPWIFEVPITLKKRNILAGNYVRDGVKKPKR